MNENLKPTAPATFRPARPKYQVFVSSTFIDLHEERKAVTWEVLKAGHIPVGMENFSAYDDRGWKVINRTLETTDYYVLILAGRYGSIDESIGTSWTEREYRRATELGIPVLAFVREKKCIPGDQVDTDEKAKKLADLISDVGNMRLREMWTTADDLRSKVGMALLKAITEDREDGSARPGWYRGSEAEAATDPITALHKEIAALRADLIRQTANTRSVLSSITARPGSADDESGSDSFDIADLEGIWRDDEHHGTYCARIIHGAPHVAYCFIGSSDLTGEVYNMRAVGDAMFGRFRWVRSRWVRSRLPIGGAFSGYVYLRRESLNVLTDGWWFADHVPAEIVRDFTKLDESIPGMVPWRWARESVGVRTPQWAEDFFARLSRAG